jgi:hypothetical protein
MTEVSGKAARTADARRDFENALDRLRRGRPNDARLAKLAAAGKLRITVASVAQEAGRSRTLIGLEGCRFPDIRDRIMSMFNGGAVRTKGVTAVVGSLRRENKVLREQVESLRSHQALVLARMLNAERGAELARADLAAALPPTNGAGGPGVVTPMPVRPGTRFGRGKR